METDIVVIGGGTLNLLPHAVWNSEDLSEQAR